MSEFQRRHSAFLVADIEAAKAAFTVTAGTPFGEIMSVPTRVESESSSIDLEITFAHALDGATELIQVSAEPGPFAPEVGLGFHHIGGIGPVDLAEEIERQEASGSLVESRLFLGEDQMFAVFFAPIERRPVRLEVMAPFMSDY